jgi:hypothetical protein
MAKPKKRKTKRKQSLSQILKRKDVKAHLRAEEHRGYIRGFNACKNNS